MMIQKKLTACVALLTGVFVGLSSGADTATPPAVVVEKASLWMDASQLTVGAELTTWSDARGGDYPTATTYTDVNPKVIEIGSGPLAGKKAVDFGVVGTSCDMSFAPQHMKMAFFVVDIDPSASAFWLACHGEGYFPFHRSDSAYQYSHDHTHGCIYYNNGYKVMNPMESGSLPSGYQLVAWAKGSNLVDSYVDGFTNDRNIGGNIGGKRLCEVILFDEQLSAMDQARVEVYLRTKWFGEQVELLDYVLRKAQTHYDASVASSIHLGTADEQKDKVIRWDDLSGNGRTLTPGACEGKIVYGGLSEIGGRPVYDMGSVGSCIDLKMDSTLTTTRSVVMVTEIDPVVDAFWLGGDDYAFHRGVGGAYAYSNDNAVLDDSEGWQNGIKVNDMTGDKPNGLGGLSVYVFNMSANSKWSCLSRDRNQAGRNGGKRLAELLTFDFTLDDETRAMLENHLKVKWSPTPEYLESLMKAAWGQSNYRVFAADAVVTADTTVACIGFTGDATLTGGPLAVGDGGVFISEGVTAALAVKMSPRRPPLALHGPGTFAVKSAIDYPLDFSHFAHGKVTIEKGGVWTLPIAADVQSVRLTLKPGGRLVLDLSGVQLPARIRFAALDLAAGADVTSCVALANVRDGAALLRGNGTIEVLPNSVPCFARWCGKGDVVNVADVANWTCTTASGKPIVSAPTQFTSVIIEGETTFNVPLGQRLVCRDLTFKGVSLARNCDWRGLTQPLKGTIDLAGRRLLVGSLAGDGIVTDSSGDAPGELHVADSEGPRCGAATVAVTGNLRVFRNGEVVYTPVKWSEADIWDNQKAKGWLEGYPIGNGQLGAMVFASPDQVRLQFNHSRLWTGKPRAYERPNAQRALPRMRQLVRERRNEEVIRLGNREFLADPTVEAKYQPFGDLVIKPRQPRPSAAFRRGLVFRDGMHVYDDGFLTCETFAPYDRPGIIVHHLTVREPVEFDLALSSPHKGAVLSADGRRFSGRLSGDGVSYAAEIQLVRENDRTLTVYLAAATDVVSPWKLGGDYLGEIASALAEAERVGYAKIRSSHRAAWRKLHDRVDLQLEGKPGLAQLPTRERLARQPVEKDPAFVKLVFDYGRYLLIAANRPDRSGEPTNLQGLWNDQLTPPWESSMTININTQMNYWPAEVCGLGECHMPLMRLLDEIAVSGAKTARVLYGAGGWMSHHNIDLWRGTCPFDDIRWGIFQTGGAWLATHIWEHYRFGGDREFLRQMWPTLRGSAEFFTDALVEYGGSVKAARGQLVTNPSMSPEHGGIREGPAIDMQIIRYIYKAVLAAAKELGLESDPLLAKIRDQLPRLAGNRIGRWGQLQEWIEDEDDPKNQFGHISHLWAVYPGDEITPETPELYAAARRSLAARGNKDTGSWPASWRICEWARFHDGGKAADVIDAYLRPLDGKSVFGMNPNLLCCGIFQVDSTFGFTAGIAEMLVQSHRFDKNGKPLVELLPALPPNWKNGSVRGLRIRGGGEVSFAWKDGKIVSQDIRTAL